MCLCLVSRHIRPLHSKPAFELSGALSCKGVFMQRADLALALEHSSLHSFRKGRKVICPKQMCIRDRVVKHLLQILALRFPQRFPLKAVAKIRILFLYGMLGRDDKIKSPPLNALLRALE